MASELALGVAETMAAEPPVTVEAHGEVEVVTLNRPGALNALSEEMAYCLGEHFEQLHRRRNVRVVVLRGAGRAFCAPSAGPSSTSRTPSSRWPTSRRSSRSAGRTWTGRCAGTWRAS